MKNLVQKYIHHNDFSKNSTFHKKLSKLKALWKPEFHNFYKDMYDARTHYTHSTLWKVPAIHEH